MSYTNHTTHYELPQWVRDDKPTFLSDMNGAFDKIDRALHDNASAIADEGLEVDRVEAKVDGYGDRLDTVEVKVGALETAQTGLDGRITHNSNDINTINSLIGNGEPTTQDKTIIGAINELAAGGGDDPRVDALVQVVGNTPLETTANTLTGAVNEVNTKAVNAQNTANTANSKADANANKIGAETMSTTAQTLTGAINELNAKPSGGDTVVVTPTLQSGTKVADISVNGVNKSIYAPESSGGSGLTALHAATGTIESILQDFGTYITENYGNTVNDLLVIIPDPGSFPSVEGSDFYPTLTYSGKYGSGYHSFSATMCESYTNPFVIMISVNTRGYATVNKFTSSGVVTEALTSTYNNYRWILYKA